MQAPGVRCRRAATAAAPPRYLNSTGSASLTFDGTEVTWISRTSATSGIADVILDGVKVATVDRYSASNAYQVPVFTSGQLTPGTHTLTIVRTGGKNAKLRRHQPAHRRSRVRRNAGCRARGKRGEPGAGCAAPRHQRGRHGHRARVECAVGYRPRGHQPFGRRWGLRARHHAGGRDHRPSSTSR